MADPHASHAGNAVGRSYDWNDRPTRGVMWITCPRNWLSGELHYMNQLKQWKLAGFPDGICPDVNNYDWILSPDPGCEVDP